MARYNYRAVEKKWQEIWEAKEVFKTGVDFSKPKYYALVEFPILPAKGCVGHPRPYTALDVVARKRRMEGYNVLFPMGWDAFGLPAENYAIQTKIHGGDHQRNINRFREQLKSLGFR